MKYYIVTVLGVLITLCNDANALWLSTSHTRTFTVESCAVCASRCTDTYDADAYTPTCTITKGTAQAGETVEVTPGRTETSDPHTDEMTTTTTLTSSAGGSYTCTCTPNPWE